MKARSSACGRLEHEPTSNKDVQGETHPTSNVQHDLAQLPPLLHASLPPVHQALLPEPINDLLERRAHFSTDAARRVAELLGLAPVQQQDLAVLVMERGELVGRSRPVRRGKGRGGGVVEEGVESERK